MAHLSVRSVLLLIHTPRPVALTSPSQTLKVVAWGGHVCVYWIYWVWDTIGVPMAQQFSNFYSFFGVDMFYFWLFWPMTHVFMWWTIFFPRMKEKTYQPESRFHWYPSGTNLILIGSVPILPTIDFHHALSVFWRQSSQFIKSGIIHLGLTLLAKAHRHIDSHQSCRATAGFPKFSRLQHCIWAQDGILWWTQQFLPNHAGKCPIVS